MRNSRSFYFVRRSKIVAHGTWLRAQMLLHSRCSITYFLEEGDFLLSPVPSTATVNNNTSPFSDFYCSSNNDKCKLVFCFHAKSKFQEHPCPNMAIITPVRWWKPASVAMMSIALRCTAEIIKSYLDIAYSLNDSSEICVLSHPTVLFARCWHQLSHRK